MRRSQLGADNPVSCEVTDGRSGRWREPYPVDAGRKAALLLELPLSAFPRRLSQLRRNLGRPFRMGDGAGDRCVDVRGGLDRLDNGGFLFGRKRVADFRQFDEDEIAE